MEKLPAWISLPAKSLTETVTEFRNEAGELVVTARFIGVGTQKQVT